MLKICIIGTGQIGYDLLIKLMKINFVKIIAFVGKRKYLKELPENIFYSDKSIEFFKLNPNCCDVVFDCTDSFSAIINNEVFLQQNIKVIDLTPSKIGEYYIPNTKLIAYNEYYTHNKNEKNAIVYRNRSDNRFNDAEDMKLIIRNILS